MKTVTSAPKSASRYQEVEQIEKELGTKLTNLFELPEALQIFYSTEHLCVITTNELLIYSVPSLEVLFEKTHYDAKLAGLAKRKKWAVWFEEQLKAWAAEKGIEL
jgi:hypothetical protein